MKKLLTAIATMLFVVSCASNTADTTKVAKSSEAESQAKASDEAPKKKKNCNVNTMGSRLKRC